MGSINWTWKRLKKERLFGSKSYETDCDYSCESEAKKAVEAYFKAQECERCGSKNLTGNNILVEITKIDLHQDITKRKLFGGTKTVEEYWKTVHRVGYILFPPAHLFSSGGHIKCKECKHRMGALGFFAQWAANMSRGN